jgi:hypothetical protein
VIFAERPSLKFHKKRLSKLRRSLNRHLKRTRPRGEVVSLFISPKLQLQQREHQLSPKRASLLRLLKSPLQRPSRSVLAPSQDPSRRNFSSFTSARMMRPRRTK